MFLLIKLYQNLFLRLLPFLSLLHDICDYLFTYSAIDLVDKVLFGGNMDSSVVCMCDFKLLKPSFLGCEELTCNH